MKTALILCFILISSSYSWGFGLYNNESSLPEEMVLGTIDRSLMLGGLLGEGGESLELSKKFIQNLQLENQALLESLNSEIPQDLSYVEFSCEPLHKREVTGGVEPKLQMMEGNIVCEITTLEDGFVTEKSETIKVQFVFNKGNLDSLKLIE